MGDPVLKRKCLSQTIPTQAHFCMSENIVPLGLLQAQDTKTRLLEALKTHSLTYTFLQSHILTRILSRCCRRPGTIKKIFTHLLPVRPHVWTLIADLNSKKINRSHLSQPEKCSDSFTPFHRAPTRLPWFPGTSIQVSCSTGPDHSLLQGPHEPWLPGVRPLSCSASCPCSVLLTTPLLLSPGQVEQGCLGKKITLKKMLTFQPREYIPSLWS